MPTVAETVNTDPTASGQTPVLDLEEYLTAYLDGAGLRDDPKGPLFRTIGRGTDKLTRTVLPQANAYAMIRRRAAAAGIENKLGNHSFRATGITAYLKNGGTLEKAAAMANHASTRTTAALRSPA
jgi:integrase